ncbi:unnamed protein product [Acanthocheilonema viteae]|uniref:Uncharacterized protein n=1 Tax=Acanthocheilonema viteae TaxID=6277 RepID=A0A498S3B5_ACAVI|nr:unnamed protein product [Acanthocheilonema viteae]
MTSLLPRITAPLTAVDRLSLKQRRGRGKQRDMKALNITSFRMKIGFELPRFPKIGVHFKQSCYFLLTFVSMPVISEVTTNAVQRFPEGLLEVVRRAIDDYNIEPKGGRI